MIRSDLALTIPCKAGKLFHCETSSGKERWLCSQLSLASNKNFRWSTRKAISPCQGLTLFFFNEKESMKRWDGGCIDQVCTCLGSLLQRQLPACIETRISRKRAKTSLQKSRFWALADLAGWRLYKLRAEGVQRVSNQSKRCWRHVLCQPSNKAFQEREYFPTFQLSNRPVTDVHGPPAVLPPWNNLRFDWSNVCQA